MTLQARIFIPPFLAQNKLTRSLHLWAQSPLDNPNTKSEGSQPSPDTQAAGLTDSDTTVESDPDNYTDESSIADDDGSSSWEDDGEGGQTDDENFEDYFQRVVDFRSNPSRQSGLSIMVKGTHKIGQDIPQSATPQTRATTQDVSLAASPGDLDDTPLAEKVMSGSIPYKQVALSPRTSRRNMLAVEMTEPLRHDLLRERSQKPFMPYTSRNQRPSKDSFKDYRPW